MAISLRSTRIIAGVDDKEPVTLKFEFLLNSAGDYGYQSA